MRKTYLRMLPFQQLKVYAIIIHKTILDENITTFHLLKFNFKWGTISFKVVILINTLLAKLQIWKQLSITTDYHETIREGETINKKWVVTINDENHLQFQTTPLYPLVSSPDIVPIDDADPEKLPLFTNKLHHKIGP